MKTFKRLLSVVTALAMVMGLCSVTVLADTAGGGSGEVVIVLSDGGITVDGEAVSTSEDDAVYIANDIIYYEDLDYYEDTGYEYGEGTDADKHSEEEAAAHTVVHITEAGTYRISGTLSCGQIFIDLGDDAKEDETAVVTLILDGVDITCTVAPAVLFYSVYECDTAWVAYDEGDADSYDASAVQDTSAAGANVIIADGSENNINGSYVAKIYKNNGNSKKLYKFDGAFYSKMSMNIDGEDEDTGILNIYAEYEGLDSELHLTINGGTINIQSQDDGINTNEDNVSVTTINGGSVHILAGLGDEGDGIDSNGYLMINGGVVISIANPSADSGLDSDCGSYINGGTVLATGSTMDWSDEDAENGLGTQPTMNLQFEEAQDSDEAIIVTDSDGNVIFAYDPDQDETTGSYNRGYQGAIISCSELEVGATYYVYVGGTVYGTDTNGLYDNSTVTGFTGAVRQIYTGTDVGMDNMPGTGNNSGMGDMGDSDSTFPGGDSGMGDMGDSDNTFPGGDSNSGDSGMGDMGDMGGDSSGGSSQIQPRSTLYDTAAGAVEEGTTYSNQFYLTDYVNEFSGVQDDPDYVSDDTDTDTDDGTTDDDTDDGNADDDSTYPNIDEDMAVPPDDGTTDDDSTDDDSSDGDSTYPDIDEDMAVPPDDGTTDDGSSDDDSTDDGSADDDSSYPDIDGNMDVPDDGSSDDGTDGNADDGSADDDSSDDTSSDSTTSGNWDAYLEYLIAYAEENYDSIAAPDSDSTVEELTAAIAELTEDTYSSSILYSVLTELGGASTYEEWLAENGTADDDTSDDDDADDDTSDVPGDSLDVIPSPDLDDDDTDDGTTDDDTSDDSTSGETASGNWDAYLEYLIAYAEENYDSIAAPDSDTTVEELTAAIAELTEDTYSSSILYSVLTELGGASTYEEWLAENGTDDDTTDDDTTDDGSSDVPDDSLDVIPSPDLDNDTEGDGSSDDGTTDDGSSDNGTTDNGSADNDSTDDGSADSGSTDNDSADNNSTDDSLTDDGSTDDGSADNNSADTDNESTDDNGSSDTGSGSSDEDTDDGGNTNAADSDTDAGTDSGSETESDADAEADTEGTGADDENSDADADDTDDTDADSDDDSSSSSDDTDEDSEASVGDHSNLVLWMVLAAGSIIALAWVGLKRRFN